jgi:SAM-dependent methyltransferase
MQMNSFEGKQVLALARGEDYAHAGEEEAIEMALAPYSRRPDRLILDVGCGRGGTAHYIQQHGWGRVAGLDIEADSIARAQQTYPAVAFHVCDVLDAGRVLDGAFDLVCLFNSFYAFADQEQALAVLAGLARAGGRLVLFDYIDRGGYAAEPLVSNGEPFLPHPIRPGAIAGMLAETGWAFTAVVDLSSAYRRWYGDLLHRIDQNRDTITRLAGPAAFAAVRGQYRGLVGALRRGTLGGAVIHAQRRP